MRRINIKDVLLGVLAASLVFVLVGAGDSTQQPEVIATDLVVAGIQNPVLVTNKGTIIRMGREKNINVRVEEEMTADLRDFLAALNQPEVSQD